MISKEVKAQLTAEYGKTPTDTGSPAGCNLNLQN